MHYAPSLEMGSISLGPGGCSGILRLLRVAGSSLPPHLVQQPSNVGSGLHWFEGSRALLIPLAWLYIVEPAGMGCEHAFDRVLPASGT
jgi:hypothetical protein